MGAPPRAGDDGSFKALVQEFDHRLRTLKTLVLLRTSDQDADAADILATLDAHLRAVENDVHAVRTVIADERRAIESAKALGHAAHLQAARAQAMQTRLPAHLPGDARIASERAAQRSTSSVTAASTAAPGRAPHSERARAPLSEAPTSANVSAGHAPAPPPSRPGTSPSSSEQPPKAKKAVSVPPIAYLTTDELNSAPAYMRSRLSLEKMNSAVDEVYEVFTHKYEVLRAPTRSLSAEQKKQQAAYKQLELEHPRLKGLLFISEEDCKGARLVKQDATGKNIMSIMRHVQRLKEVSAGGVRCWYMVG